LRQANEEREAKHMKRGKTCRYLMTFLAAMTILIANMPMDGLCASFAPPEWWAGSAQDYNQLVENARKEGKLIWYDSLTDKGSDLLVQAFKKLYPFIEIEHIRVRGVEAREIVLRELQAQVNKIDVLEVSDELITTYKDLKLFKRIEWSKKFRMNPIQFSKDNTMIKVGAALFGIAYNTNKVSPQDVPKTYEDLLDPKWKGKKLGTDDRPKGALNLTPAWGESKVIDYLKKLSKQDIIYKTGTTAGVQMLAAGEFNAYVFSTYQAYRGVKEKGVPIEFIIPRPVTGTSFEQEGVISNAPHPNAATLFLGWMAGAAGQEIRDKASGEGLPFPGYNTMTGKLIKSKDQLSIFDDEWVPLKQELHKKYSEALGFKI
jgi:iron(III) transport system substrate-binding protein